MKTEEVILKQRPKGWPLQGDFEIREVELPEPSDGELVLRTIYLSVDPYMRGRMNDVKSYVPPFRLDEPLNGGGIAQVVTSKDSRFKAGDIVIGTLKWREFDVSASNGLRLLNSDHAQLTPHLGVLGMPGLTAFVGLRRIGNLIPSDTVFISGAAGAVGMVAGQIAKISGATVIGSAGSDEKVQKLLSIGYDFAFNYKENSLTQALGNFAPNGISLYFDNVGGEHLQAALSNMSDFGRIVMCGAISQYNNEGKSYGPSNIAFVIGKRLSIQGFIVSDHYDMNESFLAEASGWLKSGKLKYEETIREGLVNLPGAFLGMLKGENIGKMIVKVAEL